MQHHNITIIQLMSVILSTGSTSKASFKKEGNVFYHVYKRFFNVFFLIFSQTFITTMLSSGQAAPSLKLTLAKCLVIRSELSFVLFPVTLTQVSRIRVYKRHPATTSRADSVLLRAGFFCAL